MIVIPMAGLSSRFFKAGYKKPKYMLEANGETLFDHAINSFKHYFKTEKFLFIIRDVYNTANFIKERIEELGIHSYQICILDKETRGQAETVAMGLECIDYNGPLTIFNIDTFRPGFRFPSQEMIEDGYLEVFRGEGDNWSFVKPLDENKTIVVETAEKRQISDLCCTGLYHFSNITIFNDAYNDYLLKPEKDWEKRELYVAPLYNYLIKKGYKIHYNIIEKDEVVFCGVPDEYQSFLQKGI